MDEGDKFRYHVETMDDLIDFAWLEPSTACTVAKNAKHCLQWCKNMGVPEFGMGDTATNSKDKVMPASRNVLRINQRFAVAYSL